VVEPKPVVAGAAVDPNALGAVGVVEDAPNALGVVEEPNAEDPNAPPPPPP
jgi:hypothetical protein